MDLMKETQSMGDSTEDITMRTRQDLYDVSDVMQTRKYHPLV